MLGDLNMNDHQNMSYNNSFGSFSFGDSANSSFSDGSAASWDYSAVNTPMSTPQRGVTPLSIRRTGSARSVMAPSTTPVRYGAASAFCQMSAMTQNMMTGTAQSIGFSTERPNPALQDYLEQQRIALEQINYASYSGPMGDSFVSHDGLPTVSDSFASHDGLPTVTTPGLVHDDMYSPGSDHDSSASSMDYVMPSQTTFMEPFGFHHSPMPPVKSLQFHIDYDSHISDYDGVFPLECSSDMDMMRHPSSQGALYTQDSSSCPAKYLSPSNSSFQSTPRRDFIRRPSLPSPSPISAPSPSRRIKSEARPSRPTRPARKIKLEPRKPGCPNITVAVELMASKECYWPNCHKKFKRQEHLKRHIITHTQKPENMEKCMFCIKSIGRGDNFKEHIKRHTNPNSTRTRYFPGALAVWLAMDSRPRKSAKQKCEENEDRKIKIDC